MSKEKTAVAHRNSHAPVDKQLKHRLQREPRAIRKILLEANDRHHEYRRSGFKGSWWNHHQEQSDNN